MLNSNKPALLVKKYSCFICGVIYGKENQRVGIFSVTKTNYAAWKNVIPELKPTSFLCDAHFTEKDIVKGYYIGQDYIPAEKWRLTRSAIPNNCLGNYIQSFLYTSLSLHCALSSKIL